MLISLLKYLKAWPLIEAFSPIHSIQERISLLWSVSARPFPCTPLAWERPASHSCCTIKAWNYRLRFVPTTCNRLQVCTAVNPVKSWGPDTLTPNVKITSRGHPQQCSLGGRDFRPDIALLGTALWFLANKMLSCSSSRTRAFSEAASMAQVPQLAGMKGPSSPKAVFFLTLSVWELRSNFKKASYNCPISQVRIWVSLKDVCLGSHSPSSKPWEITPHEERQTYKLTFPLPFKRE